MRFNFFIILIFSFLLLGIAQVSALPPEEEALYSNPTIDGNGNIDSKNVCILSINGCDNGDLIYKPGFCTYQATVPDANEEIYIQVINGNRYGSDLMDNWFVTNDQNFMVWVDRERSPVYITCSWYDSVKDNYELLDHVTLGVADHYTDTNVTKTYTNIDKDSVMGKWLFGVLFILIGALLFLDTFFNRRFGSYI